MVEEEHEGARVVRDDEQLRIVAHGKARDALGRIGKPL